MLKFIDTVTPVRYTSPLDSEEGKTVFLITPLTSNDIQIINDATVTTETNGVTASAKIRQSLRNRLAVQMGLRGWENAGKEFESEQRSILGTGKRDVIKESLLNELPIDYINDIGEEIQRISLSTGAQQKN